MRREWALDVKSSHLLNAFFLLQFGSTFLRERERFEKHSSAKPSYQ
jgi:hypothetical protein